MGSKVLASKRPGTASHRIIGKVIGKKQIEFIRRSHFKWRDFE